MGFSNSFLGKAQGVLTKREARIIAKHLGGNGVKQPPTFGTVNHNGTRPLVKYDDTARFEISVYHPRLFEELKSMFPKLTWTVKKEAV